MKKLLIITAFFALPGCQILSEQVSKDQRLQELNEAAEDVDTLTIESSHLQSAKAAEKMGSLVKAEYYYSQLVDTKPNNLDYQFSYAEVLRKAGKCEAATKGYDKVLAGKPNNVDAMEGKALCLLAGGKNPQAADIFAKILADEPNRWKSLNGAGLIFAGDKKFNEASQYFSAAAEASGDNPAVLNNQGLAKALTGNFKDGIKILEGALIKSEDNTGQKRNIALNLALVYGIAGNMDAAEKTARPHLTEPQLYNNLGVYAELGKDKELAKTYLNKALQGTAVYYERAWDNLERVKSGK
jgi:Flp pilus assembly protein TadD